MLREIRDRVESSLLKDTFLLRPPPATTDSDGDSPDLDVVSNEDFRSTDVELTGGKGSSLGFLNCVAGVRVPPYFVVTTAGFKRMVHETGLISLIEKLDETSELYVAASSTAAESESSSSALVVDLEKSLQLQSSTLRDTILNAPFETHLRNRIDDLYTSHLECLPVAVRSSATTEDTASASFAGLHDTFLNQTNLSDVLLSVRKCWASVFSYRAVLYRSRNLISHAEAHVAVVIQRMIFPSVAGTCFTTEIGTSYPGVHVAATYGLGEGLVGGEVTSDEWLLNKESLGMIKRVLGSKMVQFVRVEGASGIQMVNVEKESSVSPTRRKSGGPALDVGPSEDVFDEGLVDSGVGVSGGFCLKNQKVKEIGEIVRRIGKVYEQLFGYEYIDTEFCIDQDEAETLFLLQARPVVPIIWDKIITVDQKSVRPQDVLVRGRYSLIGAVHGRINVIENFEDLVEGKTSIEKEDILVTTKTGNYWNQYLTALRGIVTIEGSPTAHPMLIGRERKFPCVIGVDDAVAELLPHQGEWATLDGLYKSVYDGKKPLIEADSDEVLAKQFEVVSLNPIQDDDMNRSWLLSLGRAVRDPAEEGLIWVRSKPYPLSLPMREITVRAYGRRRALMEAARGSPLEDESTFMERVKVSPEGFVSSEYCPPRVHIKAFEGMDLHACLKFYDNYRRAAQNFVSAGKGFRLTTKSWKRFVSLYIDLVSYMYLSFFHREYVNQEVSRIANSLQVSKFHFERFQREIQGNIQEQDNIFREEILKFARLLLEKLGDDYDPDGLTYSSLHETDPILARNLRHLSMEYKISSEPDFPMDIPIELTLMQVKDSILDFGREKILKLRFASEFIPPTPGGTIARGVLVGDEGDCVESLTTSGSKAEYFVEEPVFRAWAELGIMARICHCDAHHQRIRGMWEVKSQLEKLARVAQVESIWECSSEKINLLIAEFGDSVE